jgi:hypothetical protein
VSEQFHAPAVLSPGGRAFVPIGQKIGWGTGGGGELRGKVVTPILHGAQIALHQFSKKSPYEKCVHDTKYRSH